MSWPSHRPSHSSHCCLRKARSGSSFMPHTTCHSPHMGIEAQTHEAQVKAPSLTRLPGSWLAMHINSTLCDKRGR